MCLQRRKEGQVRTRITVGGNLINYPRVCGTPTADLLPVKLLFNSVISTPNAKTMSIDIKDFYLCTPMKRYKYIQMKIKLFLEDIIQEYDLRNKVDATGNVHCNV
jgi:CO/xanthine dehydrogenase FAD-binding subunit